MRALRVLDLGAEKVSEQLGAGEAVVTEGALRWAALALMRKKEKGNGMQVDMKQTGNKRATTK